MVKSNHFICLLVFLLISAQSLAQVSIIPRPVHLEVREGSFAFDKNTSIKFKASDKNLAQAAAFFRTSFSAISGLSLAINSAGGKQVVLQQIKDPTLGKEGYRLSIREKEINLSANGKAGIIYGIQSLMQLLPPVRNNSELKIPALEITDYPRFKWRGMHMDVSRHFFSVETVKQYIDLLSLYKFNTFHWHLTDDQGWRIEIKKYPKLTEVGAWRGVRKGFTWESSEPSDSTEAEKYGGYYTQDQIRDVVSYAAERNITIVPEIDVPGHSGAAITAYPFLGCSGNPQRMITGGIYPPDIETSLCVSKDSVYVFMKDVLTEIIDLFPSPYIHIGGDEVNKDPWKNHASTQEFMRRKNLKTEDELQSYFIHEMEKFINSKGRKMIGWDEILEGGLAPGATVMSWRGEAGGIEAAKMGHDVVMTPGSPLYFDHYQAGPEGEPQAFGGMNTLKMVYGYNPIPKELTGKEAAYVLGAQANIWAEHIYARAHLEYMALPRMLALAEGVWTPQELKNYEDFYSRLQPHLDAFDHKGISYNKGNYAVEVTPVTIDNRLSVSLASEIPGSVIYYTTDGTWPNAGSRRYNEPFRIDSSMTVKAVVSVNGIIMSKVPSEQQFVMSLTTGKTVSYAHTYSRYYAANGPNSLTDGIRGKHAVGKYWHGFAGKDMVATIDLEKMQPVSEVTAGFMQRYQDWIFLPEWVTVEVSADGNDFENAGTDKNPVSAHEKQSIIRDFKVRFQQRNVRYIRVTAKNIGVCPPGHPGEGQPAWLFADEIIAR